MNGIRSSGSRSGRQYSNGVESKRRILSAGVKLFAKNGYHMTGIELICAEAHMGRGSLYHHIGNKEALLFEICHTTMTDLLWACERVMAEELTHEDCFRELMRVSMRSIADHVSEWKVSSRDYTALTGQRLVVVQEARDRYENLVLGVLAAGATDGEFREFGPLVVKGILGYYNYSYVWIRRDGSLTPEAIADLFSDALLGGVRAPSSAL